MSTLNSSIVSYPSNHLFVYRSKVIVLACTVGVKKIPPSRCLQFSDIFWQTVENFKSIFRHLLYVPIYARLQIFIQLPVPQTLTKLCHIKHDYLVHVICLECPPSAETQAFRRLRKSLIALLIVVCGKSSQICCFYNVNKHIAYDMTSTVMSFAQ